MIGSSTKKLKKRNRVLAGMAAEIDQIKRRRLLIEKFNEMGVYAHPHARFARGYIPHGHPRRDEE